MDDNAKEYAFVKEKYGLSEGEYNEFKARGHQLWQYWDLSPDTFMTMFYQIENIRQKLFKSPEEEEKVVNAVKKYFDYINLLKIAKSDVIAKKSRYNKSTVIYDKFGHARDMLLKAEQKQGRAQAAFDLVREQTLRIVNGKSNNVPFNGERRTSNLVGAPAASTTQLFGTRSPNTPAASTTQLFGTRSPNAPAASTTPLFGARAPNVPTAAQAPLINNATNSEKKRATAQLAFLGRPPTSEELAAEIKKVKKFNLMMKTRKRRGGKSKKTLKSRRK